MTSNFYTYGPDGRLHEAQNDPRPRASVRDQKRAGIAAVDRNDNITAYYPTSTAEFVLRQRRFNRIVEFTLGLSLGLVILICLIL